MLILTRRIGESVIIGNNEIRITIISSNNNQIRIGIDAPKDVSVHREEIYNKIKNEGKNE